MYFNITYYSGELQKGEMMKNNLVSNAFMTFMEEAPKQAEAWGKLAMDLNQANSLDNKTATLVYIGIMAAKNILSGIPFHVLSAKEAGVTCPQ